MNAIQRLDSVINAVQRLDVLIAALQRSGEHFSASARQATTADQRLASTVMAESNALTVRELLEIRAGLVKNDQRHSAWETVIADARKYAMMMAFGVYDEDDGFVQVSGEQKNILAAQLQESLLKSAVWALQQDTVVGMQTR